MQPRESEEAGDKESLSPIMKTSCVQQKVELIEVLVLSHKNDAHNPKMKAGAVNVATLGYFPEIHHQGQLKDKNSVCQPRVVVI